MLSILFEFLFVDLLLIHFLSLLFYNHIDLYPLNDIESARINFSPATRLKRTLLKSIPALSALIVAVLYFGEWKPYWIRIFMFAYFTIWIIVTYLVWYMPYIFGTSDEHKIKFQNNFGRTHQILPAIEDNPRPNTFHVVLHILFLINFLLMLLCGYNPVGIF